MKNSILRLMCAFLAIGLSASVIIVAGKFAPVANVAYFDPLVVQKGGNETANTSQTTQESNETLSLSESFPATEEEPEALQTTLSAGNGASNSDSFSNSHSNSQITSTTKANSTSSAATTGKNKPSSTVATTHPNQPTSATASNSTTSSAASTTKNSGKITDTNDVINAIADFLTSKKIKQKPVVSELGAYYFAQKSNPNAPIPEPYTVVGYQAFSSTLSAGETIASKTATEISKYSLFELLSIKAYDVVIDGDMVVVIVAVGSK
jgi:hypothetical protein